MRWCVQQCQMMDKLLLWLSFIGDHQGREEQDLGQQGALSLKYKWRSSTSHHQNWKSFTMSWHCLLLGSPIYVQYSPGDYYHVPIYALKPRLLLLMSSKRCYYSCPSYVHSIYPYPCPSYMYSYYLRHPYMYSAILPLRWKGCSVPSCVERYFSCIVPCD